MGPFTHVRQVGHDCDTWELLKSYSLLLPSTSLACTHILTAMAVVCFRDRPSVVKLYQLASSSVEPNRQLEIAKLVSLCVQTVWAHVDAGLFWIEQA